jgi:beta-N-acetylhexosaminidase
MHGGGFLWIGFEGTAVTPELAAALRELRPYGYIFFTRNITAPDQLKKLSADLLDLDDRALLAIDLEGGNVDRLKEIRGKPLPAPETVAHAIAARGLDAARESGAVIGAELRAYNIPVDYAPCVDLGPAAKGSGLEKRLYGATPDAVIAAAGAFLAGLNSAGVSGCLKHYPGLGGSDLDSHHALPEIPGGTAKRKDHLQPYQALHAKVPFMMIAHASYPQLYQSPRPASINAQAYYLLRTEIGFAGATLSDDLHMKALGEYGAIPSLAVQSLGAGADAALICKELEASIAAARAIDDALREPAYARQAEESLQRLHVARERVFALARSKD